MTDADTADRSRLSPSRAAPSGLPERPVGLVDRPVAGWREPVTIDSYLPLPPDRYPAFLDRRVYQGSTGRVYPLPFFSRISSRPQPVSWDAIHLENRWLRLMILPALGGRIHAAYDLARQPAYDFFWHNSVIKPALVGLAGPWVAGGVELNWPQHHRPATFLPCATEIEEEPDGSVTVWCSDHDPLLRMKGMHGVRLRPDSSLIELRVRLYNRTELPQTFLWWANVAARVDDQYQSFFPADVSMVADHAKRAVTAFPAADRPYYGIDYPARADRVRDGVAGDRLDWYRNIDVPTSYMCVDSGGDFFGGYDHGVDAGFVHVADHRIAPGKKQWTWGCADFGRAWNRQLADDGSAYIELMAGVYTDNQPDFSWLAPGETKTFSQYWYPISGLGPVQAATTHAALRWRRTGPDQVELGIAATRHRPGARVEIRAPDGTVLATRVVELGPGPARWLRFDLPRPVPAGCRVAIRHDDRVLLDWQEPTADRGGAPTTIRPAEEPPAPEQVDSVERLWAIGVHLQQYRHATRSPVPYWEAAVQRDPGHSRSLSALAEHHLRCGEYARAAERAAAAVARLTEWNPNPQDGSAFYLLGLARERLGDPDAAYDAFAKATWTRAWRGPAGYRLARIDAAAGRDRAALHRLEDVAATEPEHLQAAALRVIILRRLGRHAEAGSVLEDQLRRDRLHAWSRDLAGEPLAADPQTWLDVSLEYAGCGEIGEALRVLELARTAEHERQPGAPALGPMLDYYRAAWLYQIGDAAGAREARRQARSGDDHCCFPVRSDDADLLSTVVQAHPDDALAHGLLGHWLYARDRRTDAIRHWREAARLDPGQPVIWRNLALAAVNVEGDLDAGRDCFRTAAELAPQDARLWYENDVLAELRGVPAWDRLQALEAHRDQVAERDDLTIRFAELLITAGRTGEAEELLRSRTFQPWEGGEGVVLACWDRIQLVRAEQALAAGQPEQAIDAIGAALEPPDSLGEARHPLANTAPLRLARGDALHRCGDDAGARREWQLAADQLTDVAAMAATPYSAASVSSIRALRRLGDHQRADQLVAAMHRYLDELARSEPRVDYFATSLPDLLLFHEDPGRARDRRVAELRALLSQQDQR